MVVVSGATSRTGGVVARELLRNGLRVRALGRNVERLKPLSALGAEIVVAEPANPNDIKRAMTGATSAYVMLQPNYLLDSSDFPAFQQSLIDSLVPAIRESALSHVVALSSWGVERSCGTGPVLGLRRLEEALSMIEPLNVVFLRAGWFMENLTGVLERLRHSDAVTGGIRGDLPLPMVATEDIGHSAAALLTTCLFRGKSAWEVRGPQCLSIQDAVDTATDLLDKPRTLYYQLDRAELRAELLQSGASEHIAMLMVEVVEAINQRKIAMCAPPERVITTATSFADFVRTTLGLAAAEP
jgi:uncharacterized protein YbjT (DUF2867 family)